MKVLKRKDMLTKVIAVRVSPRAKAEFDDLRERADAAGFDIGATLRDMLYDAAKQIRNELDAIALKPQTETASQVVNGFDHTNGSAGKVRL
jgi:hypothetical protein